MAAMSRYTPSAARRTPGSPSTPPSTGHAPPALSSAFATARAPPCTAPDGATHSTSYAARSRPTPRASRSADCQGTTSQRGRTYRSVNRAEVVQKPQSPS
ncbi:hypothetical protein GCM10009731_32390 [Streptomyces globosus]